MVIKKFIKRHSNAFKFALFLFLVSVSAGIILAATGLLTFVVAAVVALGIFMLPLLLVVPYIVYCEKHFLQKIELEVEGELSQLNNIGQFLSEEKKEFKKQLQLAKQGNGEDQFQVAKKYYTLAEKLDDDSPEKPKLKERAVKYYDLAAAQGHAGAQNNLGVCYELGEGVKKDLEQAVKYYSLAADRKNAVAQRNLGVCYKNGKGVEKDLLKAIHYFQLAVKGDDSEIQKFCRQELVHISNPYYEKGLEFEEKGELGKIKTELNKIYESEGKKRYEHNPLDDQRNFEEAVEHYQLAADRGHVKAQFSLGSCYEDGRGVKQDLLQAVKYYRLAAGQGYSDAYVKLGECYEHARGVEQDLVRAVEYYQLGVAQGNAAAQYNLGECYEYGRGVKQDLEQAVEYYRLAAGQGYSKAQVKLGECYEHGRGVKPDLMQAVRYYQLPSLYFWKAREQLNRLKKIRLKQTINLKINLATMLINKMVCLNNGWIVCTLYGNSSLTVWDSNTGEFVKSLKGHTSSVECVGVLKNGQVVSGSSDGLKVWDMAKGECVKVLGGDEGDVIHHFKVLSNDQVLVVYPKLIEIWDIQASQCVKVALEASDEDRLLLRSKALFFRFADILPDGSLISIISSNEAYNFSNPFPFMIRIQKLDDLEILYKTPIFFNFDSMRNLMIMTSNGLNLLVVSQNNEFSAWDVTTGKCKRTFRSDEHEGFLSCLKVHNNQIISASTDKTVRIWDVESEKCLEVFEGHTNPVTYIHALSKNKFITASGNGAIKLYASPVVFLSESEIRKNTRTLHEFLEPNSKNQGWRAASFFSHLPRELISKIICDTRDPESHTEEEAQEIILNHSCKPI